MSATTCNSAPAAWVGKVVQGWYPAANYRGVPKRYEWRRLLVERVRQLHRDPLEPDTLTMDPLLERGQTLLIGTDLDKQAPRAFYLESLREPQVLDTEPADTHPWQVLFAVCPPGFSPQHPLAPAPMTWLEEGEALAFARGFNACEQKQPHGLWAVVVRPHKQELAFGA